MTIGIPFFPSGISAGKAIAVCPVCLASVPAAGKGPAKHWAKAGHRETDVLRTDEAFQIAEKSLSPVPDPTPEDKFFTHLTAAYDTWVSGQDFMPAPADVLAARQDLTVYQGAWLTTYQQFVGMTRKYGVEYTPDCVYCGKVAKNYSTMNDDHQEAACPACVARLVAEGRYIDTEDGPTLVEGKEPALANCFATAGTGEKKRKRGGVCDVRCGLPYGHMGPCEEEDQDDGTSDDEEEEDEEEDEADEPDEDSITTRDDRHFYQYGKLVLTIGEDDDREDALIAFMHREQFWPDCWSISDHGNAHRIDLDAAYARQAAAGKESGK